jgi:3,4-dihydroxy 2-butanone 4-phosphate synthase/GTP cyclohydrolase II
MDPRLYGIGAQILRQLGVRKMRLNVSSKRSLVGLAGFGLEIVGMSVMEPKTPNY